MKYHNLSQKHIDKLVTTALNWHDELFEQLNKAINGEKIKKRYEFVSLMDIYDWITYCNLIIRHEFYKARNMQRDLDTASYEEIPNYLYNTLQNLE